ncbi:uncharacterized protein LOC144657044 [Oculina patagonica]
MMNLEGKEILQQRSSGWVPVYMDKGSNNLELYQKVPCSIAEMLWCEDRGPEKNGVSDVRRELNLSESVGEHKWICWSSTGANIITNAFSREGGEGSARNSCDVPVLGSISKDLNLTQSLKKGQALKEGQAFIDMESRQDSVSTDKHD